MRNILLYAAKGIFAMGCVVFLSISFSILGFYATLGFEFFHHGTRYPAVQAALMWSMICFGATVLFTLVVRDMFIRNKGNSNDKR